MFYYSIGTYIFSMIQINVRNVATCKDVKLYFVYLFKYSAKIFCGFPCYFEDTFNFLLLTSKAPKYQLDTIFYQNHFQNIKCITFLILNSERSDECIDFTMMCVFFFVSVTTFWSCKSASIFKLNLVSDRKRQEKP
ncbi:Uncharacterized protein FWK35_00015380 [Aphis craccivora]|uniref:Uncharacterized protein n=1 Tax=Aphis craccivora TaxID=307492 RepID=A0A6G0Y7B7_APHCR|nr:Uncharacterized protein FWK35_00015380 [Aphis craccivora]